MWLPKTIMVATLVALLLLVAPVSAFSFDGTPPDSTDIVLAIDVSGSVNDTDPAGFARNALRLGVDLAPENSRVAIVAFNASVVMQTDFVDVPTAEGRRYLRSHMDNLQNSGNTNFAAGLEGALNIMSSSVAYNKRVILLGDFGEGGYNAGTAAGTLGIIQAVGELAAVANGSGVIIDMVLWENAPSGNATASAFLSLPESTNGNLHELPYPNLVATALEEIYFQSFTYLKTMTNVIGTGGQSLHIHMPTHGVRRARIFVSSRTPVIAFGASYAGADVDSTQNASYSVIDIQNPSPQGVNLTLSPGADGTAIVYTILEYNLLGLSFVVDYTIHNGEAQTSTVGVSIVDAITGQIVLDEPYIDNAVFDMQIIPPYEQIQIEYIGSNVFSVTSDQPEKFGIYAVRATVSIGGITLGPIGGYIEISDSRQIPTPTNWPLIISLTVGGVLVLSALFIAYKIRSKEAAYRGAIEMNSDYLFHGKLSIYAIMLEGGEREMKPFEFALHKLGDKRVSLREVLDSVGAKDTYNGAQDVLFLVGPEESLIVRNNSKATIKVLGRDFGYKSKVQLFYGQKMYIIFEKDENELELTYRKIKEENPPMNFSFGSRRTQDNLKVLR